MNLSEAKRHLEDNDRRFSFVSLYAGAGGMDMGFAGAGFYPVWSNEKDKNAAATYSAYFKRHLGHEATPGDILDKTLRAGLRSRVDALEGVELVIGGPPCQGFSVAGKMDPNDPRSKHVYEFLKVVDEVKPRAFVMENVMALARNRRWSGLIADLEAKARELRYSTLLVQETASNFGVAQNRERMFLIGIKGVDPLRPIRVTEESPPTVRSVLETLPSYGSEGNDTKCVARITLPRTPVLRRSAFAGMLFNGQGRPLNLEAPAPTLPASMGGNRTPIIDQATLDDSGRDQWIVGYHRYLWDAHRGINRSPEDALRYGAAPDRLRRLTVEEAATLQSFPDDVEWHGRTGSQFKQIGNAVPPRLAFHVATALRRALDYGEPAAPENGQSADANLTAASSLAA